MHKYYLAVVIICIFCVAVILGGFTLVGNPFLQQSIKYDATRMSNFYTINNAIINYYYLHSLLPDSLNKVAINNIVIKDPETNKVYGYKILDKYTYELCTIFSLDSKNDNKSQDYSFNQITDSHKKGNDCIPFDLSGYYNPPTPTPDINHACSTVYGGICRPNCEIGEIIIASESAVTDCAKNSKGNPICCAPSQ